MTPKAIENSTSVNEIRSRWAGLKSSYKAAIVIAMLTLLWMLSGIFSIDLGGDNMVAAPKHVAEVQVISSKAQMHTRTVAVYGRVKASRAVDLKSKFDAIVSDVVALKGSQVKKGEVLVRFNSEGRAERLAETEARLVQAEISFEAASKLGKEGFRSKINTAGAKADLKAAMAAVATAQSNFNNTIIRAPFAGIVDNIPVEIGDMVSKGRMAAKVINISKIKVVAEVAERDAANVALGGASRVHLMDGRILDGTVSYVSKSSNVSTRTYSVEVSVDVPDMSVPEGVTAELILPMETILAHLVTPAILTLNDDGALGIKTVSDDGTVEFHAVEMVSDTRRGIWISGLNLEEKVIVVGQEFVQIGHKVEAVAAVKIGNEEIGNGAIGNGAGAKK